MRDPRFYALHNIAEVVELGTHFTPRSGFERMDLLIEDAVALDYNGKAWKYRVPYKKQPDADESDFRLGAWMRNEITIEYYNEQAQKGEVVVIEPIVPRRVVKSCGQKSYFVPPELQLEPICKCGAKMQPRENAKSKKLFWGCPNYPRCRGARTMSSILQKRVRFWSNLRS